jgi:hypothetical protein
MTAANLAPILLFVYNRPWHTQQTLEALQKNELADQSDLIIYSDAPKNDQAWSQVQEVRDYLKTISGFKSIQIIEREENWGLAKSIISGVTETVNQYGKIIVLEDDIVTSPAFLSFMNQALDFYQNQPKVWHISGWNYPIDPSGLGDTFLWRVMNCWGWATWADRWAHFEKNPQALMHNWSEQQKHHFDLDGSGVFWHQVTANAEGKMNTWAIFWYATIYEKNGLCLNPTQTYVDNIGHDGSGVHCGDAGKQELVIVNQNLPHQFTTNYQENTLAVQRIKEYYQSQYKPIYIRAINKLARLTIGKNIIQ